MADAKETKKNEAFAVIETGGKQYCVKEGDTVKVEKLSGVDTKGDKVMFDKVLVMDTGSALTLGAPYISGASVEATLEEHGRAKKIDGIRYRPKSRHTRRFGHRQPFTSVKIVGIK